MVSVSLFVADLILFWASRCVIPSVLTPSMAEMMSPCARLPPTALLPGVIYRERERGGGQSLGLPQIPQGTQQEKNICSYSKLEQECCRARVMNEGQIPSVAELSLFQSKGISRVLEIVEVRKN